MLLTKLYASSDYIKTISTLVDEQFDLLSADTQEAQAPNRTDYLKLFRNSFQEQLQAIWANIQQGFINPLIPLATDQKTTVPWIKYDHQIRIGVLGLTANPLHYGHIFLGLQAMRECQLDKVVFLTQGYVDKPGISEPLIRHEMVQNTLETYKPLLIYSSLGKENWEWAEQRLMTLIKINNPDYHYVQICGDDRLNLIYDWQEKFAAEANIDINRIKIAVGARENSNNKLEQIITKLRPDQQTRFDRALSWTKVGALLSSSLIRLKRLCCFVPYPAQLVIRKYELYKSPGLAAK